MYTLFLEKRRVSVVEGDDDDVMDVESVPQVESVEGGWSEVREVAEKKQKPKVVYACVFEREGEKERVCIVFDNMRSLHRMKISTKRLNLWPPPVYWLHCS